MEIVFIYGIPAVGKLTVANELAKITGFKVFHNHLTHDLIHTILDEKDDFFWKKVRKLRYDCVKIAKKKNVSLIMTACYMGKGSDMYFKPLVKLAKKEKIKIRFVHLICNEKIVLKRVKGKSRLEHRKLMCPVELKGFIDRKGRIIGIPYVKSLEIDNSRLSPKTVARMIKKGFKL